MWRGIVKNRQRIELSTRFPSVSRLMDNSKHCAQRMHSAVQKETATLGRGFQIPIGWAA